MKASKMNGTKVITANAYVLGEVDGAEVDTDKWKVTHLDVNLTKEATEELGFKKPFLGSLCNNSQEFSSRTKKSQRMQKRLTNTSDWLSPLTSPLFCHLQLHAKKYFNHLKVRRTKVFLDGNKMYHIRNRHANCWFWSWICRK